MEADRLLWSGGRHVRLWAFFPQHSDTDEPPAREMLFADRHPPLWVNTDNMA